MKLFVRPVHAHNQHLLIHEAAFIHIGSVQRTLVAALAALAADSTPVINK